MTTAPNTPQDDVPDLDIDVSIPVFLKSEPDADWQRPTPDTFYLVARNGVFLCRNTGLAQTDSIVGKTQLDEAKLTDHSERCLLSIPKLPSLFMTQTIWFFWEVYKRHQSECIVLYAWNQDTKQYEFIVPEQEVSGGAVDYKIDEASLGNRIIIGDCHSHASFAAYSSGTDHHDEVHRDGLHVVFGNFNRMPNKGPSCHIEWTSDGRRFKVDRDLCFEPFNGYGEVKPHLPEIQEWLTRVKKKSYIFQGGHQSGSYDYYGSGGYYGTEMGRYDGRGNWIPSGGKSSSGTSQRGSTTKPRYFEEDEDGRIVQKWWEKDEENPNAPRTITIPSSGGSPPKSGLVDENGDDLAVGDDDNDTVIITGRSSSQSYTKEQVDIADGISELLEEGLRALHAAAKDMKDTFERFTGDIAWTSSPPASLEVAEAALVDLFTAVADFDDVCRNPLDFITD